MGKKIPRPGDGEGNGRKATRKGKGGIKLILHELEKHYKKEGRVPMMSKVKAYYKVKRGSEEPISDYIVI